MIELTRLNGTPIVLNCELIKTCEASPDTMITLLNGEKLIIREKLDQVVHRVRDYRAQLLAEVAGKIPGFLGSGLESTARINTVDRLDSFNRPSPDAQRSNR